MSGDETAKKQIYKSLDGKSFIASDDTDLDGYRYKSYIEITFITASEIKFYLYMGMQGTSPTLENGKVVNNPYFTAEYEGTLTKSTT